MYVTHGVTRRGYLFQFKTLTSEEALARDTGARVSLRRVDVNIHEISNLWNLFHELVLYHPKLISPKAAHRDGNAVFVCC